MTHATNETPFQAIKPSIAVQMLLKCYVGNYGYELFTPDTREGGVFSVVHYEQKLILTVLDNGTIRKYDGFHHDLGALTNGEVRIAEIDAQAAIKDTPIGEQL